MKEVVATLSAVIRHITSNCVEGFGFLWLEELEKIAQVIGGKFPYLLLPEGSKFSKTPLAQVCAPCLVDRDCGEWSNFFLKCGQSGFLFEIAIFKITPFSGTFV